MGHVLSLTLDLHNFLWDMGLKVSSLLDDHDNWFLPMGFNNTFP